MLFLNSGNPNGFVREFGGTGRTYDWSVSRRIRDSIPVPIFLAGGFGASNVAEAIAAVQPFGLDLCSGVRTNDNLDSRKLSEFFAALPQETQQKRTD